MLLVRSQTGASSVERVHYLTRKPSFDALRDVPRVRRRAPAPPGRAGRGRRRRLLSRASRSCPGDIDVAIHSAATVAFDPPIDEGFQTNLLGAMNLYRGVLAGGSRPALVHVSTAYVAGVQKGVIPERTLDHRVDWRLEADLALQSRRDVEAASRKPELLERFLEDAAKEHSRAGPTTVADDAEQRRKEWMTKRLVEYGRQRARSLGWPDVYTFTKAMGERAVEELAAEEQLSAVDRSAVDHRVRVAPPVAGMDRRLQDGRPDHPGVRAGADPRVPRHPGRDRRHHPGGLRRERDPRRGRDPADPRRAGPLPRVLGRSEPAPVPPALHARPGVLRGASAPRAGSGRAQGPRMDLPGQRDRREDAPPGGAAHRHRRDRSSRTCPSRRGCATPCGGWIATRRASTS